MQAVLRPLYWALAMVALACGARLGWVDRDAAITLLLVLPLLAVIGLRRGNCCAMTARNG